MKIKEEKNVIKPSGKGWLNVVKKGLKVVGSAATFLLAAPIKLPNKLLEIAKYVALLVGIVKATEKEDEPVE